MLSFIKKNLHVIILLMLFCFLIFYYYFGIFNYNYIVPPGDDPTRHMTEAKGIIDEGFTKAWAGSLDPPLFHALLAITSFFGGLGIVETTLYVVPFIFIVSYFAFYFCVKKLFKNQWLAILALVLLVFVARQPRFAYTLGTYLNLFAGLCLFVFGLAFFKDLFLSKNIDYKKIILCFLFFGGVMLTHSLSTTYMLMTLIFIGLVLLILKLLGRVSFLSKYLVDFKDIYFKNFLILLVALFILITPLTYDYYLKMVFDRFQAQYEAVVNVDSGLNGTLKQIVSWNAYENNLGIFVFIFSLISLPFFVFRYKNNLTKILILSWILALFIATRSTFFILPERFALDLALPLTIVIACFFLSCCNFVKIKRCYFVKIILIFFVIICAYFFVRDGIEYRIKTRLQKSDAKAIDWLVNNIDNNSVILTFPRTLAMKSWGSYVELLTNRKVIDGSDCLEYEGRCPWIYDPNSKVAKDYYKTNNINYIYAGKKVMGNFNSRYKVDWNYQSQLLKAVFLEKKVEFFDSNSLGKIIIFKVDRTKL